MVSFWVLIVSLSALTLFSSSLILSWYWSGVCVVSWLVCSSVGSPMSPWLIRVRPFCVSSAWFIPLYWSSSIWSSGSALVTLRISV